MNKESEPIDRLIIPRDQANGAVGPRWRPSPLACWFFAITGFDALMLLFASGVSSSGNDAAGNGMANAFREVFVQAGTVLLACIAVLFIIVRHKGAQIGLTAALVLLNLLLPILMH